MIGEGLNVGCGRDVKEGYVNADLVRLPGVDVTMDILDEWPFEDERFGEVFCSHVVEHLPQMAKDGNDAFIHFMEQAHRVLKPGGKLVLKYPAPTLPPRVYYGNPTHYRYIPPEAYRGFLDNGRAGVTCVSYWTDARFKTMKIRYRRALLLRRIGPINGFHIVPWHWMKYMPWLGRKLEMIVCLKK